MSDQSQPDTEELAKPAIGGEGNEPETELETPAIGEGEETEETEQELDDLDFGFKKWRVPKELKEGVEKLNATFTQKTQEYSSKASELEAEKARLAEQSKASDEELEHRANLRNIDAKLKEYQAYTDQQWAQLKAEDPQGWNEHQIFYANLERRQQALKGVLSEAETKRQTESQSASTKRVQETQAHAMKITGWTPKMDEEVVGYAISKGYTADKVAELLTPAFYDMCRLARIGEATLKSHAAPKPTSETPAEPLEMVGAKKNPPPAGLNDSLPMDEWLKRREKQVKAKG